MKRSCVIMATTEGQITTPVQTPPITITVPPLQQQQVVTTPTAAIASASVPTLGTTSIALPQHPVPVNPSTSATAVSQTTPAAAANPGLPQITVSASGSVIGGGSTHLHPQQPQQITLAARTSSNGSGLLQPSLTSVNSAISTSTTIASIPTASAVLSWPSGPQFAPTFQIQQPLQFTYQPQTATFSSAPTAVSTGASSHPDSAAQTLEQVVSAAAGQFSLSCVTAVDGDGSSGGQGDEDEESGASQLEAAIASEAARHHGIS